MAQPATDAIVLHQFPGVAGQESLSNFCVKVHRMLAFKGHDYEVRDALLPNAVAKLNPRAKKLPVLDFLGDRITDSTRIADALDAHTPEPAFWPADARDRALAMTLEDWADESLYWFMVYCRWNDDEATRRFVPDAFESVPGPLQKPLAAVVRRGLRRALHEQGLGRLTQDQVDRQFQRHLDSVDALVSGRDWLVGSSASLSDIAVFSMLHGLHLEAMPRTRGMIEERAGLCAWAERVDALTRNRHTRDWS